MERLRLASSSGLNCKNFIFNVLTTIALKHSRQSSASRGQKNKNFLSITSNPVSPPASQSISKKITSSKINT